MDKLEYEMNRVAEKAAKKASKKDAIKAIQMLKRADYDFDMVLREILQSYGDDLPRAEIKKITKKD
ncbi:hypothetical protein [Lactobacillus gallinarum]|uniref:Uncharacterized protein n=1 Tax=Lactobacillus gallinarum TaxID=52242 RepID=A0A1Y4W939_9LACO|nr:hypothetical protein [Lactobacillus gallinarum]OUQ78133.1 hypothetical protein B5E44_00540 [Lactobacillus gallinarum]